MSSHQIYGIPSYQSEWLSNNTGTYDSPRINMGNTKNPNVPPKKNSVRSYTYETENLDYNEKLTKIQKGPAHNPKRRVTNVSNKPKKGKEQLKIMDVFSL